MDKLIRGTWAVAVLAGLLGACAQQAEPDDTEVVTREIDEEELAKLISNADEVVPVTDLEVTTFRSAASSCGITVTQQGYAIDSADGEATVSVSCSHGGCAGNPGGCSPGGCQPGWDNKAETYYCSPPTCVGTGCAPIGCTMKTTLTEAASL